MITKIVGAILAVLIVFEFYCVFAAEEGSPPQSPPSAAEQGSSSAPSLSHKSLDTEPSPPSENGAPDSAPESKNEQKNEEPAAEERLRAEIFQMFATPILTAITVLLSIVFYFSKAKKDQRNLIGQLRITSRNAIVAAFANDTEFRNAIEGILKAPNYQVVKDKLNHPGIFVLLALRKDGRDLENEMLAAAKALENEKEKAAGKLRELFRKLLSA